jgi:hypothetical protein
MFKVVSSKVFFFRICAILISITVKVKLSLYLTN